MNGWSKEAADEQEKKFYHLHYGIVMSHLYTHNVQSAVFQSSMDI